MNWSISEIFSTTQKGKRNALFLILLVFFFPIIPLINYAFEIQSGIISKLFRLFNLAISLLLIFEFVMSNDLKSVLKQRIDKEILRKYIPFILFSIFWLFYVVRMVFDLEVFNIQELTPYPKSYFYLYTIGITLIPMAAVATMKEIDFNFLHQLLYRFLIVFNLCLLFIFVLERFYLHHAGYRFYITRNDFDYLNAITIAVYGSLLVITSFLQQKKTILNYLYIALGFFIILTTASRGPILSVLIALLFILFFKDKKVSAKYFYLLTSIVVAIGLNYLTTQFSTSSFEEGNPLLHRLENFTEDQSTVSRIQITNNAIHQILESPIFGSHFIAIKSEMYSHNIFLDILISTGFLGFLLITPIFFIFAKKLISNTTNLFIAVIGFYLFLNTLTSGASYNMTEFWIFLVVIVLSKQVDLISTKN